jgi:hypothetical protein
VESIDFNALDFSVGSELDDAEIAMLATAAAGFPTIVHAGGAAGEYKIVAGAVKHIAGFDDTRAVFDCREIDEIAQRFGHHFAMDAEAGDAAIGINVEAEVGEAVGIVNREEVLRVAFEGGRREDFGPGFQVGARFEGAFLGAVSTTTPRMMPGTPRRIRHQS